jgi:RimJ/RimL family protein N-acetyltransferase
MGIKMNLQPVLEDERVILKPLDENDFEDLYGVASDPKIWEQHPNKDRWKKEIFKTFFEGALQSKGAFKITDKISGKIAGSTRFYGYDAGEKQISIGYTFFGTGHWGKGLNQSAKQLMLDYAFNFVSEVHFHIGAVNIRSQIAITRLGAEKFDEKEIAYYGEEVKLNYVYRITKKLWRARSSV